MFLWIFLSHEELGHFKQVKWPSSNRFKQMQLEREKELYFAAVIITLVKALTMLRWIPSSFPPIIVFLFHLPDSSDQWGFRVLHTRKVNECWSKAVALSFQAATKASVRSWTRALETSQIPSETQQDPLDTWGKLDDTFFLSAATENPKNEQWSDHYKGQHQIASPLP